ncbi:GrBNV gp62-like protein-like protein [Mauternbach virus]|uniref:GrBNV gp62-like protein-like protein n=1 Tax=Mauternbach virus TaxID=2486603 RepID=A0A3G3E673_9VIRU|nr:GrBNV gp62-like protein-like protein [Mauternbach virus]AYP97979.1 GrBNV gp62-like protein-like protein [Mauternbach virus]
MPIETFFISSYVPKPNTYTVIKESNKGCKLKLYNKGDVIPSLAAEFQMLYDQKYTHVVNAPGRLNDILVTAKEYKLICLDSRMGKYVAEYCSKFRTENV